jgi:hypothetical protein
MTFTYIASFLKCYSVTYKLFGKAACSRVELLYTWTYFGDTEGHMPVSQNNLC